MHNIELNNYLQDLLKEEFGPFICAPAEPPAIRINTLKTDPGQIRNNLERWSVEYEPLAFTSSGFRVKDDHLPLSHTLDFFRGFFFYQGISSQIPPVILNPRPGEKVLDISAAPGSKTAQMGALMKNRGMLVANDISRSRMQPLNVNTQRTGLINQLLYNQPGERLGHLFPEFFDKVLIDAPCSGLGTLNTHPEIWTWWSGDKMRKLVSRQKQLLISGLKALKTGGDLVYSTCSIAPEENEKVVEAILDHYPVEVLRLDEGWYERYSRSDAPGNTISDGTGKGLCVLPHRHGQEGFFIVKLRKKEPFAIYKKTDPHGMLQTFRSNEEPVKSVLQSISATWGIPFSFWETFRFYTVSKRLWMLNADISDVALNGFMNGGLLLAEKRLHLWRLTNQSVQFLYNYISKNRTAFSAEEMVTLFSTGTVPKAGLAPGYHILEWEGSPIATIYSEKQYCKIRLPHYFRLVL